MRILLVEDEPQVASFVQQGLMEEGYSIHWVLHGKEAILSSQREHFDLVILDLRLPDISGLEVCRQIRLNDATTPILMLTALDGIKNRVEGLQSGADDYLPKPFAFEELVARIQALHRRATTSSTHQVTVSDSLQINPISRECVCNGHPINLSQKEFDLLAYFTARGNQVLDRDTIHRDVWGNDFDRGTNLIDVYVGYLRRKLQDTTCGASIETVRGIGYRYRPNP